MSEVRYSLKNDWDIYINQWKTNTTVQPEIIVQDCQQALSNYVHQTKTAITESLQPPKRNRFNQRSTLYAVSLPQLNTNYTHSITAYLNQMRRALNSAIPFTSNKLRTVGSISSTIPRESQTFS